MMRGLGAGARGHAGQPAALTAAHAEPARRFSSRTGGALLAAFVALALCAPAMARGQAPGVRLARQEARAFTIQSGDYEAVYGPEEGRRLGAGIQIRRRDTPSEALFTRMAHGPSFNVTDYGTFVGYEHQRPKKDFSIFRRLECRETASTVEAVVRTSRAWADFTGSFVAYKDTPGLFRWTVRLRAREDKAVNEPPLPDVEFRRNGAYADHEVIRHMAQRGPATGIVFFRDVPLRSEVFYLQDFSSLSRLYELTGCANPWLGYTDGEQRGAVRMGPATSEFQPAEVDGKTVPATPYRERVERYDRFGYLRPECFRIPRSESLTIVDTWLYLRPAVGDDNVAVCRAFVEMLAPIYRRLPKPPPVAVDWAGEVTPRLVRDILRPENSHVTGGRWYPRAYVGYEHRDIQLWNIAQLLLPLTEYCRRYPAQREAAVLRDRLDATLPDFWDEKWQGFANNPAPMPDTFYTGVYLFNPAYLVADLAAAGNANARRMILGYRAKLLEMGRACDYVFADVSTSNFRRQKVLYQYDTTCMYLYIMMRLHQLSGGKDAEALDAAKAAAARLAERRMDLCWEVNQTATGILACEWLHRATGDPRYRELAWVPIANTLRWAWLWQGRYGIGKRLVTFWGFCGTPANPHSCEYESHQVRRFVKEYLALARERLPADVRALLEDCWRRGPTQSWYALPPVIVKAGAGRYLVATDGSETDCGMVARDQWVPLEDFHGGWGTDLEWWQGNSKLGQIGQEIYGAGGPIWYALWQAELPAPPRSAAGARVRRALRAGPASPRVSGAHR